MTAKSFQLSADAARSYEAQKVPAMFGPLAGATVDVIRMGADEAVLDVACGTGVMVRTIAERAQPRPGRLAGCDLNAGMIEVARELTANAAYPCEWYEADVCDMPFGSGEFSLCFCQQGLQFFPDKLAALREIARVLAPEGRVVLTVWSEVSPLFVSIADALRGHVNEAIAEQSLAPFSFRDADVIARLLAEAGYASVACRELTINRTLGPAPACVRGEIAANPVGAEYQGQTDEVRMAVESEVATALQPYATATGYAVPQKTHLVEASLR